MNRINTALNTNKKLLSIYFTAGYPNLDDTVPIIESLEAQGVDMIEIGLPFSDPLADGPTIQESSRIALENGMCTNKLFEQLEGIRERVSMPMLIMGYFNPILQFGITNFCKRCKQTGIDGLIIPDLPLEEYLLHYKEIFQEYDLKMVFLITPQTSDERIREIDRASESFIYMVSSAGVTGGTQGFGASHTTYFDRVADLKLNAPKIVGFGIKDRESLGQATQHAQGGIIGSAFINHLTKVGVEGIASFISKLQPFKP